MAPGGRRSSAAFTAAPGATALTADQYSWVSTARESSGRSEMIADEDWLGVFIAVMIAVFGHGREGQRAEFTPEPRALDRALRQHVTCDL
jgi:hypothetical protein